MMKHFPEQVDPFKFSKLGENLVGKFELTRMKRLNESLGVGLDNGSNTVEFTLDFGKQDRAKVATGNFSAGVNMSCQRCLKPVAVAVRGEIHLEFVVGEEIEGRLEDLGYETVVVVDESLSLLELIEDEVLLAIPFAPLHHKGECPGSSIVEKLQESDRPNPFAVLAKLKKDQE